MTREKTIFFLKSLPYYITLLIFGGITLGFGVHGAIFMFEAIIPGVVEKSTAGLCGLIGATFLIIAFVFFIIEVYVILLWGGARRLKREKREAALVAQMAKEAST